MYYNSNKNNNDYYNSYKREILELEAYRKEENLQKFMKLMLSLIVFTLLIVAIFYLYKYLNPIVDLNNSFIKNEKEFAKSKPLTSIVIREEALPLSIQLRESSMQTVQNIKINATDTMTQKKQKTVSSMNEKDIELIVQIIMSQMNTRIEKPLEEQLQEVNNKIYTNKSLSKTNHYNKVVLTKNEVLEVQNVSLMELSTNLSNIMNEEVSSTSNYTQSIKKEVLFRTNEMRVIIVQRGDTLSRIAKKAYGDYDDYPRIFAANPEIIKNPNQIFVGQRLRIPA
jgi:LysM repeat protein